MISITPAQPRRMPITWYPSRRARIVTARMAGFSPGTSPPPVRIPITPLCFLTFAMLLSPLQTPLMKFTTHSESQEAVGGCARHKTPFDFHFGDNWREQLQQQMADGRWLARNDETRVDRDLAAHITMTLSRGVCLYGRSIGEVFPAVPRDDYIDSIVSDFEWAKARIAENPVYFILNACRVLACLSEGLILSK